MFVLFGSVTGLCGHTHGPWEPLDSASIAVRCRYYKSSTSSQMADMHASPSCLPRLSVAAGWRNRHILTKKLQFPCGKVLPTVQTPESEAFGIHCSGAQHKDSVRYGKVGNVGACLGSTRGHCARKGESERQGPSPMQHLWNHDASLAPGEWTRGLLQRLHEQCRSESDSPEELRMLVYADEHAQ